MSLLLAVSAVRQQAAAPPPAGGITYVGGAQDGDTSGNNNDLTLSGPSVVADDFGLLWYYSDGAGGTNTYGEVDTPSGWTLESSQSNTGGRDRKTWLFWRRYTGSTTAAPTLVNNNATSRARGAILMVFRGVDTTTAFDVTPEYGFAQNDTTPSSPSITPVTANGAIVSFVGFNAGASRSISWGSAEPSGFTIGPDFSSDRAWGAGAYLLDDGAADATGALVWSPTGINSNDESGTATVALRAA